MWIEREQMLSLLGILIFGTALMMWYFLSVFKADIEEWLSYWRESRRLKKEQAELDRRLGDLRR